MTFFVGSICLFAAAGDIRKLLHGGVLGATRIAWHLWRMCFGLFIAAGSFFWDPQTAHSDCLLQCGSGSSV